MIRPVELQDALSKTQAVEKIVQSQKANPENEQRNALAAEEKRTQDTQRRTTAPAHSDEVILHRDHQQEKKNKNEGSGKNAGQNEDTESASDGTEMSRDSDTPPPVLDIQV